jgi:hypothetical protein
MMATSSFFGGSLGKAEGSLKSRKDRLDEEERKAMGEPAKKEEPKEEKAMARPPMSKKWYE